MRHALYLPPSKAKAIIVLALSVDLDSLIAAGDPPVLTTVALAAHVLGKS
jgi:hypothetical protein